MSYRFVYHVEKRFSVDQNNSRYTGEVWDREGNPTWMLLVVVGHVARRRKSGVWKWISVSHSTPSTVDLTFFLASLQDGTFMGHSVLLATLLVDDKF